LADHPVHGGNPASKKIVQNRHRLVLPIDDHRNNEKFRLTHPDVVFEGLSKPKKKKASKLHPIHKHNHHIKTKHIPHGHVPNSHAKSGDVSMTPEDDALYNLMYEEHVQDNDSEENGDGSEDFLFHEMINEEFDLFLDDQYFGGTYPEPNGNINGSVVHDEYENLPPPTNLSISSVTLEPQVISGDGIPTYVASLFFSTIGNDDEYEIRIMKQ